ncbi:MAG TPA: biotin--[acetyl-CoA-carboxylase] ligase [Acidimicrobiales bacterium]|nr:biotin--[acetyl-CoA-carboxylase] ligase [Acidimicrobiales bacterium]
MLDAGARSALAATRFADVRWVAEIDSTNRYLLDEARAGSPEGVVVVADHQTAGRGRLGRTWTAPPGASLLVSILLRPRVPVEALHLVTVAVGLAAADACAAVTGVRPELKWPNDLIVGDRKLAGVLAEADLGTSGPPAVVVGIGINANWPDALPEELAETATALNRESGRPADRAELLVRLLGGLEPRYAALDGPDGRTELASEYRRRCATIGRAVRVDLTDGSFAGEAVDVSDEGHLLVSTDACLRTVSAADVVHLRPL